MNYKEDLLLQEESIEICNKIFDKYWKTRNLDKYFDNYYYNEFKQLILIKLFKKLNYKDFKLKTPYIKVAIHNSLKNILRNHFIFIKNNPVDYKNDITEFRNEYYENIDLKRFYSFLTKEEKQICNTMLYIKEVRKVSKILHKSYNKIYYKLQNIKRKAKIYKELGLIKE